MTPHGKLITHLTKRVVNGQNVETDREELHFFYDSQSRPAFVEYDNAMYRYVHNLQGDIVAIVDEDGNAVVEYKYDAWGKLIYKTNSTLSTLNPFRYRRYVWDEETELYYLRSRYYTIACNRFISSDCIVSIGKRGLVQNSFSYCRNNPIKYQDLTGAIEKSVDEIIEYSGCFEDDFNVLLIVHVPDVENIEEGYIGHIEVALKYFDKWRIYSYGPASHSGITANSGSADACLKVREGNDKWETKKYKYSSYGIAFYRPSLLIRHAIQVMSEDLGKTGEFKTPATGKYDMKNSNYDQYSLVSGLGCVCRDYANRILTALSIDVLNEYNSADEYFPKGFYNAYRNR